MLKTSRSQKSNEFCFSVCVKPNPVNTVDEEQIPIHPFYIDKEMPPCPPTTRTSLWQLNGSFVSYHLGILENKCVRIKGIHLLKVVVKGSSHGGGQGPS